MLESNFPEALLDNIAGSPPPNSGIGPCSVPLLLGITLMSLLKARAGNLKKPAGVSKIFNVTKEKKKS